MHNAEQTSFFDQQASIRDGVHCILVAFTAALPIGRAWMSASGARPHARPQARPEARPDARPDGLEHLHTACVRDLALPAPEVIADSMQAGGFAVPLRIHQAGFIRAGFSLQADHDA